MKFLLISRHTNGAEIPENEREQNLQEMGEWIALLKPALAMPIRGGRIVSANSIEQYGGDIGGQSCMRPTVLIMRSRWQKSLPA
jgi:hypothetical protein